jgi:hypothetical protein
MNSVLIRNLRLFFFLPQAPLLEFASFRFPGERRVPGKVRGGAPRVPLLSRCMEPVYLKNRVGYKWIERKLYLYNRLCFGSRRRKSTRQASMTCKHASRFEIWLEAVKEDACHRYTSWIRLGSNREAKFRPTLVAAISKSY